MGMSKMAKEKELESKYGQMVRKILQNIILINYMDARSWNTQMVTVIGGDARMVRKKDMEDIKRWAMETDSSGNTWMMSSKGMEYTDGLMEECITESTNRIMKMAKDITGWKMVMNIGENTRITCYGERESNKRREYYTETNTKKASASAGVKFSELKSLSRN
jgi:hypothetical protein